MLNSGGIVHCLHHAARMFVPFILITAAIGKVGAWESYIASVVKIAPHCGVAPLTLARIAPSIPAVEAGIGLGLLVARGRAYSLVAWGAFGCGLIFVAVRAKLLIVGVEFACPCFGRLSFIDRLSGVGSSIAVLHLAAAASLALAGDPLENAQRGTGGSGAAGQSRVIGGRT